MADIIVSRFPAPKKKTITTLNRQKNGPFDKIDPTLCKFNVSEEDLDILRRELEQVNDDIDTILESVGPESQEQLSLINGQPRRLSQLPISNDTVRFYVNGLLQTQVEDYTINGDTIFWKGDFSLDGDDDIVVTYQSNLS